MKISARNVFDGTVEAVKLGAVNSEVDVTLAGGKPVLAIIKASSVMILTEGNGVKLSARNRLEGTISALTEGPVSTEVALTLANGNVVSATITHAASVALGLKVGTKATAIFKAPSVIIGVPA